MLQPKTKKQLTWKDHASDAYTNIANAVSTAGMSAVGDAVNAVSPKAAVALEKYSLGMIPHTKQKQRSDNRSSNPNYIANRVSSGANALNGAAAEVLTGGLIKGAGPAVSKLGSKFVKEVSSTLSSPLLESKTIGKKVLLGGIKSISKTVDNAQYMRDSFLAKSNLTKYLPGEKHVNRYLPLNSKSKIGQAKDVAWLRKDLVDGAGTLDKAITEKITDLGSEEGKRRLFNHEKEYLTKIGFDKANLDAQAKKNAGARVNELIHTKFAGNRNMDFLKDMIKEPSNDFVYRNQINNEIPFHNANFQAQREMGEDIFNNNPSSMFEKNIYIGGKEQPGKLALGYGYGKDGGTAAHEVNHALQNHRKMPLDDEIRAITLKSKLSDNAREEYKYFANGSKGMESSSFLAEARNAMKESGIIKNTYDEITPEIVEKSIKYFKSNPSKNVLLTNQKVAAKQSSNTRIFDFMENNLSNRELVSKTMNKLPAALPVAGLAATAAVKSKKQ